MWTASLLVLLSLTTAGDARSQVEALLANQAAAWSRGDIEAFCSVYADDVLFISPSGLARGRQQVIERYRKRYPDAAAMGRLALEIEEVRLVQGAGDAPAVASVAARWRLSYPDRDELGGWTLLVLHRQADGSWKIVQDASM